MASLFSQSLVLAFMGRRSKRPSRNASNMLEPAIELPEHYYCG